VKRKIKVEFSPQKIKSRNGSPGKRVTELKYTPALESCQREYPRAMRMHADFGVIVISAEKHSRREAVGAGFKPAPTSDEPKVARIGRPKKARLDSSRLNRDRNGSGDRLSRQPVGQTLTEPVPWPN
jgi:hypothetical protein